MLLDTLKCILWHNYAIFIHISLGIFPPPELYCLIETETL